MSWFLFSWRRAAPQVIHIHSDTSTSSSQSCGQADLGAGAREDTVAASSPETMEPGAAAGAAGEGLGTEAKPRAPAAKARFLLTRSRPVPGRAGDPAPGSPGGPVRLDVSPDKAPGNKGPSEPMALPAAAAPRPGPDKTPAQTPARAEGLPATPGPGQPPSAAGAAAPAKPKDAGFFDKLFKLDKGRDRAPADLPPEAGSAQRPRPAAEVPGLPTQAEDGPAETVSPNKAETKKDLEDTGEEKSPSPSANLKSDKANVSLQEPQGAAKNSTSAETAKEGAKEKGGPSSLPLGKLFWKKSVKEDSVPTGAEDNVVCESPGEAVESEEVEAALQTVDLGEEGGHTPEPAEETPGRGDRRASRPSLLALLRQMSVKGDGGITHSEEINGKDSGYQTADPTEKVVAPPQLEAAAAGQKGKEGPSKDKKAATETNKQKGIKQEAKEPAPAVEPAAMEANSLPNGDKSQKRPEKRRQSLGGFFKGLGSSISGRGQLEPTVQGPGPLPREEEVLFFF
ncbi:hypothetical protein FD755_006576 [Muntiacus reevesi]|uniref:Breast carcinoma amplified sequence 1 n=1 Tax=Muntiacus reevesi TaxID=9886 RepID=A0A5J5MWW6_MUNRE|nr:hypothetical protein FD755_006576 [Muntiacus reevesi]